ncbi:MAG: tyrosine-type recombinase/integrase, partial [Candidatus Acetothermia bacterium]
MNWNKQAYGNGPKNGGNFAENDHEFPEGSLSEDLPLEQAIEDFKMMAKVEGRAEKTLNLYDYVFDRFTDLVDPETSIGNIEKREIRNYLASLMDEGLKNTTVSIHHRVLNAFFTWLVKDSYLKKSPTEDVEEPKTPDKFPKYLNDEQIDTLLETAKQRRREWSGYRNYTMLVVFLDMGLRLN